QVAEQMLLGALRERGLADDAEAARRRAAFLAEAGRLLAESVDQASTLVALTKLALPNLGDWCVVDILEEDETIRRLGIYHSDREKQILADQLEERWAPDSDDPFGAAAMLRGARTIAITGSIEATLAATAHGAENLDILRQLGIGCLLSAPLVARGKLLGAVTFIGANCEHIYSAEELQLGEDLASRAALALDNARNYDSALLLRQSAEAANKAKTEFLGAMSHELRTPLNAIGGYIDLLDMGLRGPVTAEQRADFARVKRSQQHLTLLITEILNFARAGAGGFSYAVVDINVDEVMRRAVELIEPLFAQKEIEFDGISGDASIVARADSERVTQILVNLLSNAIKFTAAGGRIRAEFGATADTAVLHISDTGIGIDADKLEAIFEPFVQLKEGLADRADGVGLGLAISRDLARAMNGDLTVTSNGGRGSRFTLSLPRAVVQ
ncbi:MAG: HAMP domain-containing histidine kinase, partial [Gemmatimonadaceae bacterium]|nr:HAMP domain-containing histidine kinase [Gemmatimonadaceae bacterium]